MFTRRYIVHISSKRYGKCRTKGINNSYQKGFSIKNSEARFNKGPVKQRQILFGTAGKQRMLLNTQILSTLN